MLQVENLDVHYGAIQALHTVSLEVRQGEIVSLIGANGAGKSTFLKVLSGIHSASAGVVTFEGQQTTKWTPQQYVKKGIALVPEGRRIFKQMTVLENIELGAYLRRDHEQCKKDIETIYERFPILFERKHQNAATLSGGEQQMLAIGRALMSKPKLLLLDEPSMGLAPNYIRQVFELIQEINNDGTTILLIEQNAKMALSIADRGYVLEVGKVVLEGSGAALLNSEEVREAYLGG
ncbi:ABC transporter ATP-binding protein [Culicoidibacter larvae]|uniref:ABC transporter ATP-binding protein n=1 Tax=Culicoidibacter larvae TaxID=2579976 RepID=A0A5R8QH97_9FIRM|nr:ABC transporter ATP-binding protein [Culicoidibacter larvae]TLG77144.1 ABC transporter ATP-binding protein [Culicoidibacter larvae]